ncbi:hypothetical protein ACHQM5_009492 [Ranunculus cassubicifolius]
MGSPPATSSSSSSSSISQTPNPINNNPQLQNITNFIPIKLKKENHILWKSLFLPVLTSFDLLKFVDGSSECPPKLIKSSDPAATDGVIINPDYTQWIKSDQTLLIWMNATISEELLPYVIGCPTSRSLWITLERRLGHLSHSHIHQLRNRLQNVRKGNSSIATYLQQVKQITDGLAASGNIVEDSDLVFHILNGLSNDYDSFSTSVRLRDPPISSDVT